MNRLVGWGAAVALLAATGVVVAITPDDMSTAIENTGRVGDRVSARLITVELVDVSLSERIELDYEEIDGSTAGVWVVAEAIVTPTMSRINLDGSSLRIGGTTYGSSDLLGLEDVRTQPYGAGVPQQGILAFEIPKSALDAPGADHATMVFATESRIVLDSVPVFEVDLTELPIRPSTTISAAWVPDVER